MVFDAALKLAQVPSALPCPLGSAYFRSNLWKRTYQTSAAFEPRVPAPFRVGRLFNGPVHCIDKSRSFSPPLGLPEKRQQASPASNVQ
jgi:hypothetical protein